MILEKRHTASVIIGWMLVESVAVASRRNLLLLGDDEEGTELVAAVDLVNRAVGRI